MKTIGQLHRDIEEVRQSLSTLKEPIPRTVFERASHKISQTIALCPPEHLDELSAAAHEALGEISIADCQSKKTDSWRDLRRRIVVSGHLVAHRNESATPLNGHLSFDVEREFSALEACLGDLPKPLPPTVRDRALAMVSSIVANTPTADQFLVASRLDALLREHGIEEGRLAMLRRLTS